MNAIDLHCHGGGGASFGVGLEETRTALEAHRTHGTERLVASLVTAPLEVLEAQLAQLRTFVDTEAGLLGAHLEGPFLAPERKGAHDPQYLIAPTRDAVLRLLEAADGALRQITIAPDLPGALDAIPSFVEAGVVVAIGHTAADFETASAAFDRGATLVTHAFNAMAPITARSPGVVAAALRDERVTLELIADGIHVHPSLIALVFALAPGRVALVTDAIAATGSADGTYSLGGLNVEVAHGRAVVAGTDTLAGSTLTLDRAVEVAVAAGVSRADAVAAVTTTPARVLGLTT